MHETAKGMFWKKNNNIKYNKKNKETKSKKRKKLRKTEECFFFSLFIFERTMFNLCTD